MSIIAVAALLCAVPATASETITYSYDAQGRLVKVVRSGTVNNGAGECYNYDSADNRSNVTSSTTTGCQPPTAVSFSVLNNAPVTEGAPVVFTIKRNGSAPGPLTVNYGTSNGTAQAPLDYTSASGTLTFQPSDTWKTVTVQTIDDTLVESPETFTMNLSAPSGGATIANGTATQTINDNDNCNGVQWTIASNTAVTEGQTAVFTVTKWGTTPTTCSVDYATAGGTATSGLDFTPASGTLTFAPSDTVKTVNVATIDDTLVENTESFTMNLTNAIGGATIPAPTASVTINDNDSINHPPVANPDTGSVAACGTVTVNVVANDTDQDGDYPLTVTAVSQVPNGTATIASGTSISYTDLYGTAGQAVLNYTVTDTRNASSVGTLTITIRKGFCTSSISTAPMAPTTSTPPS